MAILRLTGFGGQVPMLGDRALPDGMATSSINTWFYGNELRGIRVEELLPGALSHNTFKVLRLPRRTYGGNPTFPGTVPSPAYLGDSKFVQLPDPDTDIVSSAMIEDQWERWYFCDAAHGVYFNTRLRMLEEPTAGMYTLGVIGPGTVSGLLDPENYRPVVAAAGGTAPPTGITENRAYVYTWVNEFDEESGPSLPTKSVPGNSDGTWTVTGIKDPPNHPLTPPAPGTWGPPTWKGKYLYRTIVSGTGFVNYYRVSYKTGNVADRPNMIPMGVVSHADTAQTAELTMNPPLETVSWVPPPPGLEGILAMANGFLIGFKGSDLYFSEAYHYHAWPFEYKYSVEHPIVGLGRLDTTCVVCTQGYPYSVNGMKPATVAFNKANTNEPCLSRGSIVSSPYGVLYASSNGLMMLGPGGFQNATEKLITRGKWAQDFTPSFIRAVRYNNGYLALRAVPEENEGNDRRSIFYFDPSDLKVALTEMQDYSTTVNLVQDLYSGEVLLINHVDNTKHELYRFDPADSNTVDKWKPVLWRSKEFQFQFKENFSCYAIYWDDARFTPSTDVEGIMPPDEHVHFKVWAGRTLIYDHTVPIEANGKPVRLPSGFKSDIWQFEVRSRCPIYSIHIASTVKELKSV